MALSPQKSRPDLPAVLKRPRASSGPLRSKGWMRRRRWTKSAS